MLHPKANGYEDDAKVTVLAEPSAQTWMAFSGDTELVRNKTTTSLHIGCAALH